MPQSKKDKQEKAKKRLEERALLTPGQQLEKLDKKYGVGLGARRERARLLKLLQVVK